MKKSHQFGVVSSVAFALAASFGSPALSQEASDATAVEEVIVTAQKRAENVRDVPLAISAFSEQTLEAANVDQLFDLQRLAPSLRVDNGARADKLRIVIRGVGSSGGTAMEPSVATFIDGVYIPREGATTTAYLDLEAVEVLRGPQGTLFGRNASVGAISLRSAPPRDDFDADVAAEYGTGDRYKLEGFVNMPVSDRFALRLAALGESFAGLYKNKLDGDRVGGVDTPSFRLSGKARITDEFQNLTRLAYSHRTGNDYFTPLLLLPDTFPAGGLPIFLARYANIGSDDVDLDPFDTTINQFVGDILDDEQRSITNELSYNPASGFGVKLISGYRKYTVEQVGHQVFGAETATTVQFQLTDSESSSHELQFISPENFIFGRGDFVAGLYYFHEDISIDEDFQFTADFCRLVLLTHPLLNPCIAGASGRATDVAFTQETNSIAAYAQLTYPLLETLDLTLGARWTKDEKDGLFRQSPLHPAGALLAANETAPLSLEEEHPTYRVNLGWKPLEDVLLFASYTTGFKSGGFNSTSSPVPFGQARKLRPETVTNAEVGAKTAWFDNRLYLDVVAYQMEIDDFQDRSFTGVGFAINNAGGIRNRGVETDMVVRPTNWMRLSANVAYLDSEFTSYPNASRLPGLPGTQDITGTRPTFSPEWSGTLGAELHGDLGESGLGWRLRSDLYFTTDTNISSVNDNNPRTTQEGYSLLSMRATLFGTDRNWEASVFGSNLTDEGYCTSVVYQPFGPLIGAQVPGHAALRCNIVGTPRTFGIGLRRKF